MTDEAGSERRTTPRIEVDGGQISGQFTSLAEFLDFFAINISEGGMKISADQTLPVGASFHFRMDLGAHDKPFEGLARVQWARMHPTNGKVIIGAQFVSLTPDSKDLVKVITSAHKRLGINTASQTQSGLTDIV